MEIDSVMQGKSKARLKGLSPSKNIVDVGFPLEGESICRAGLARLLAGDL